MEVIRVKLFFDDTEFDAQFARTVGKAAVGMYYTTAAAPTTSEAAKKFLADYKKKFNQNPEPYAAESYVATAIALKAIESATAGGKAPSREAIATAIRKIKYTGMTGLIPEEKK